MRASPVERFLSKLKATDTFGCWEWTGYTAGGGYGMMGIDGGYQLAHRLALRFLGDGAPAPGSHVLHLCDNVKCCNPLHLREGTREENMADMRTKRRHAHGERNHSKLTAEQVFAIRADCRAHSAIAAQYNISKPLVSRIKRGLKWGHL